MGYSADFTEYSRRQTARDIDLDETVFAISNEPGELHGWSISNVNAAVRYVKLYDAAAADVTVGSTVPKLTLAIPGSTAGGLNSLFLGLKGIGFRNGIAAAALTGVADNDTTGAGTNEIVANFIFSDQSIG